MAIIDLGQVSAVAMTDEIWANRGKAIQAYANLENSFCALFAYLAGIEPAVASIVFFKITSQDVRNKIIEKLLRKKVLDDSKKCVASLLGQMRELDKKRNAIVHWTTVTRPKLENDQLIVELVLHPPGVIVPQHEDEINNAQLIDFINQCAFRSRLVTMYSVLSFQGTNLLTEEQQQTWREIFSQPMLYPPPEVHPLSPISSGLHNLLRSFVMT